MQFLVGQALGSKWHEFKQKDPGERVIRFWLLYFEAASFYNKEVGGGTLDDLITKASAELKTNKEWQELDVTDEELKSLLSRFLQAKRLFLFKEKASMLPVPESEVRAEYAQNKIRYGNLSYEEAAQRIQASKARQSLTQRLERWFKALEKKYRVQRFRT